MRFGSVCSGIEAASVAWNPLGWEAAWFAEIEPFPSAVLAHHYPQIPNHGDMTKLPEKILSGEIEAPDMLCGGTPCFTEGQMVLTESGYKPIEEIQVGEMVMTHKGRLRKVLRTGSKIAEIGELTMVGHEPIICTPNHPFLSVLWENKSTKRNGQSCRVERVGDLSWTKADELPGKQWTARYSYDLIPCEISSAKFAKDDFKAMLFIGLYLGDGCILKNSRKGICGIKLSFNAKKFEQFKNHFGDIGYVHQERTAIQVDIFDKKFAEFILENFGEHSHNKKIPAWVLSHPYRQALLDGYLATDGAKLKNGGFTISTVSEKLALGVTDLLNTLDYVASSHLVEMPSTCVIEGRLCNQRNMYQVRAYPKSISRKSRYIHGYLCRLVKNFKPLNRSATVYNIEVDEDHSYFVGGMVAKNCQAFSVAGQRKSLDDDRGNLSLVFTEIADAIDNARLVQGRGPCVVFWENVPGVLSVKDNAFGCFMAQLVGANVPLTSGTDGNKWPSSGYVVGPKRQAAWRVLDAQYFGVPQRRRRVFVVASASEGFDPSKVLFESPCVPGDSESSSKEGQGTAEESERGSSGTSEVELGSGKPVTPTVVAGYGKCYNDLKDGGCLAVHKGYREGSFGQFVESEQAGTSKASGGVLGGGSETLIAESLER